MFSQLIVSISNVVDKIISTYGSTSILFISKKNGDLLTKYFHILKQSRNYIEILRLHNSFKLLNKFVVHSGDKLIFTGYSLTEFTLVESFKCF